MQKITSDKELRIHEKPCHCDWCQREAETKKKNNPETPTINLNYFHPAFFLFGKS
jgi:hypothetical protein